MRVLQSQAQTLFRRIDRKERSKKLIWHIVSVLFPNFQILFPKTNCYAKASIRIEIVA